MFRRFGRYLSTRLDLLSGADCLELAGLPDRDEALSEAALRAQLRSERGVASLRHVDPAPVESRTLSQTHRAWLSDGRLVSLKLARLSAASRIDLGALPQLSGYLSSLGWPLRSARRVVAEFAELVARRLDLQQEAEALARLRGLPGEPRVRAPKPVPALSSRGVLTLELPPGAPLFGATPTGPEAHDATGPTRILTDVWTQLAFEELRLPEELSADEVWRAAGGVLELTGGLFYSLSGHDADALWRYLLAAARDDPDAVFTALEALTEPARTARPQALRLQLGHVVPRRDGRFGETPPGFPELLLAHWLHAERHGFAPRPALLAFYRGLVSLRELTGPALSHEVFRESLQAIQIARGGERLRRALDPSLLARSAEGAVRLLTQLPRVLERAGLLRDGQPPSGGRAEGEPAAGSGWATLAAGLLLAATLVLWFQRLPNLLGPWTETAQALAVLAFGAGLLRWIWKQ